MNNIKILIATILILSGCATDLDKYSSTGGTLNDHFIGGNYNSVLDRASSYCNRKGMKLGEIEKISSGCLLGCSSEFNKYEFSCMYSDQIKVESTNKRDVYSTLNIENAKKKCTELGFNFETEQFKNCVLQLLN